ncbi:hypothetical protein KR222_010206, partial [Zaprionus bogoriensis]
STKMEEIKESLSKFDDSLKTLINQVLSVKDDIRKVSNRVSTLESDYESRNPVVEQTLPLARPRTEYELKETLTLPDCVKELQIFEGQSAKYVSWVNRAQSILDDYAIVKEKPLYRSILLHIRQKIRGGADSALLSYNVPDDDWLEIKRVLALHYADKRDTRTLEYQLKNHCLTISPGVTLPLLAKHSLNVHLLLDEDHPEIVRVTLKKLIHEFSVLFEPLLPGGAVDTVIKAEIHTSKPDPIYTRSYPYPANMRDEVEK